MIALQEAESFPAAQNSRDCLWALGVVCFLRFSSFCCGSNFPQQRSKRQPRDAARDTSLQRVHCHRRIRRLGNSTPLYLSTGRRRLFLKGEVRDLYEADAMGAGGERQVLGDGQPECKRESERGAMISREE